MITIDPLFSIESLNRDLTFRFLGQALPGLSISVPRTKPHWDVSRPASVSTSPISEPNAYTQAFSPGSPAFPSRRHSGASSYDSGWSDSESLYTSDGEWPDWSRWTRRNSTSSQSTALTDYTDEEETIKPLVKTSTANAVPIPSVSKKIQKAALHPAKTGFALWVGNLSSRTTLEDLRGLFGTPDLQSIYLIQRTGCAFVNYNTKSSLDNAIEVFDRRGGKLYDHELVIKAQYGSEDPQTHHHHHNNSFSKNISESSFNCNNRGGNSSSSSSSSGSGSNSSSPETDSPVALSPNRYFICKSLMVDDLEEAKQTGKWSTQLRNKEKFNAAFFSSKNTYLVFSANRTSAFYGIARLEAPFTEGGGDASVDGPLKDSNTSEPEIKFTPEFVHPQDGIIVPAGETVFDPLRGSQFWKVEGCACVEPETEKWTAPASIKWLSSANSVVPFSKTRQLKNSLNMNKPIKVARDGTEIDPLIGEKLRKMFD